MVRGVVPGELPQDPLAPTLRRLPAAACPGDLHDRPPRLRRPLGRRRGSPRRRQAHIRSKRRQALVESWNITSSTGRCLSFATSSATRAASQGPESTPSNSPPYSHGPSLSTSSASRDRKSTRLNSSHSQISYAVFCLKKKRIRLSVFLSASL